MRILSRFRNKKEMALTAIDKERYYDEYVRKITPTLIEEYPDHIVIDNEVFATCIVVGVPPSQTGRGFPRNLQNNFTDQVLALEATNEYLIGISYGCEPVAHEEAQLLLDDALYKNKISRAQIDKETKKSSGTSAHSLRYDLEAQDFIKLYDEIYNNEQRLFDCQYIISLWSHSMEGLKNGISRINGVMDGNIVRAEVPYYVVLATFISAQPFPISTDIAEIQQLSHDCGVLLPLRDPLVPLSDTGLIYGERKVDDAPFVVNLDNLAAGHHLIVGSTGSGKTVLLMKLLMGCYDLLGHRFVYITPKPDNRTNYLAVADYYKDSAIVINIGSKKGYKNINPLQVIMDMDAGYQSDVDYVEIFNNHLELVTSFFRVLNTSDNMDNYVNESLIEVYKRNGIIRKDVKTWKNRPGDKWPVLLDLREVWKEDAKKKNPSAEAMLNRTSRLETSWEYINRPTDVQMDKDIIIIDISSVPDTLRDAMNVFVTGLVGMRFNTDLQKKSNVIIDEGRVFLNDKKLAEFILKIYTQGRSFGLNAWFTTQQPSDARDEDVRELLKNNSFVNVIMGNVQPNSYQTLKMFFNLSSEDIDNLKACGIGQGLVQVNNTVTAVNFSLTDLESRVILGTGEPGQKTGLDIGYKLVDDRFATLAMDNNAYLDDWIDGDAKVLSPGRDSFPVQRAFRGGTTRMWVKSSIVENGMILNQSIDHYGMVLQIASYLLHKGFSVEVNHHDDADIVATMDGQTIAIEYERPGSHTVDQLIEKNQRLQTKYGRVVFVVTSTNFKLVSADNCIGMEKTVTRGIVLREYLENLIHEFKRLKPVNQ
jgi:hypothetical protein